MKALATLAAFHRQGGLAVVTRSAADVPLLRSVLQPDGDLLTVATPQVIAADLARHMLALDAEVERIRQARNQVRLWIGAGLGGVAALATGLGVEDQAGWMTWVGAGAATAPVGLAALTAWRLRRWFGRGSWPARDAEGPEQAL